MLFPKAVTCQFIVPDVRTWLFCTSGAIFAIIQIPNHSAALIRVLCGDNLLIRACRGMCGATLMCDGGMLCHAVVRISYIRLHSRLHILLNYRGNN
jgi:hypothetical protein